MILHFIIFFPASLELMFNHLSLSSLEGRTFWWCSDHWGSAEQIWNLSNAKPKDVVWNSWPCWHFTSKLTNTKRSLFGGESLQSENLGAVGHKALRICNFRVICPGSDGGWDKAQGAVYISSKKCHKSSHITHLNITKQMIYSEKYKKNNDIISISLIYVYLKYINL